MLKHNLKICFLTRSLFPVIGGGETYVYEIAKMLAHRGHEISVITSDISGEYEACDDYPFQVRRVPGMSEFNYGKMNVQTLVSIFATIKDIDPDVLWAQNVLLGLALILIHDQLNPSSVLLLTDHNTGCMEERSWISGINCFEVELSIGRFVFRSGLYDYMITPSRFFYHWAVENGAPPHKVVLIPHGVDTDCFHSGEKGESKKRIFRFGETRVVLCPGRFLKRKGQHKLLDAFEILAQRMVDLHLVFSTTRNTSEPVYRDSIYRSIARHPFKDRIHTFADHFAPSDMPEVYRASDCVAFISDYEGFGLVGVEALASGVPLVGRMVQGLDEYLVDEATGVICQDNIQSIADQLERTLTENALRRKIIRGGLELVREKFCLSAHVSSLEALLRKAWKDKNANSQLKNVV